MGKAEQRVPNSESVCCRLVASKGGTSVRVGAGGCAALGGTKLRADLLLIGRHIKVAIYTVKVPRVRREWSPSPSGPRLRSALSGASPFSL